MPLNDAVKPDFDNRFLQQSIRSNETFLLTARKLIQCILVLDLGSCTK